MGIEMAQAMPSVDVVTLPGYPALKMIWQKQINKTDMKPAFHQITEALRRSRSPMYVVVDLRQDPQLPIAETMMEALRGPFRHPQLAEWLVFGANRSARTIGAILIRASKRNNIRWFDTEDEVLAYLNAVKNDRP